MEGLTDIKQANRIIDDQKKLLTEYSDIIKAQKKKIDYLQARVDELEETVDLLKRNLYGKKSEKRKRSSSGTSTRYQKSSENKSQATHAIPDHLERRVERYDLEDSKKICPHCGSGLDCIGESISEQLEVIPTQAYVRQRVRPKYACRKCGGCLKQAPLPNQAIEKSLAGASLLSQCVIDKYQDALPLYRQQQRWLRLGVYLPASTLSDWIEQSAFILGALFDTMRRDLLKESVIHMDDTPIKVLSAGKTKTGRFWVYRSAKDAPYPIVLYRYTPDRCGKWPASFLSHYTGYLQADAYRGHDKLYKSKKIKEVACLAHARRKFVESLPSNKAEVILKIIGELYKIEKRIKALSPQKRYWVRRHYAKPLWKQYRQKLRRYQVRVLPQSNLGKAITYSFNHFESLKRYLEDGKLAIDNNAAERAIRPLTIGRKNYLFVGSHRAGQSAAILYSIIETCKANGVHTFDYLKDVLTHLPHTLTSQLKKWLPYHWQPASPS